MHFFILILMLFSQHLAAITLDGAIVFPCHNQSIDYLVDEQHRRIDEIIAAADWQRTEGSQPLGFFESPVWYRMAVTDGVPGIWTAMTFLGMTHDQVDFYLVDDGVIKAHQEAGPKVDVFRRATATQFTSTRLIIEPGPSTYVYWRVVSRDIHRTDLMFFSEQAWEAFLTFENIFLGFFYGGVLFTACLALIIAISFSARAYMWYSAFCLSMVLTHITYNSVLNLIWPDLDAMQVKVMAMYFTTFCVLNFPRSFLDTKRFFATGDWILGRLSSAVAIGFVLACIPSMLNIARAAFDFIVTMSIISTTSVACVCRYRRVPFSGYYLAGWLIFNFAATAFFLTEMGVIEISLYSVYGVLVGQLIETMIFNFAMHKRISMIQLNRKHAEIEAEEGKSSKVLVRILTHDISNHIGGILSYIFMAKKRVTDPEAQKLFLRIEKLTRKQKEIVRHVREMVALKDGKKRVPITRVNALDAIEKARDNIFHLAERKNIRIEVKGSGEALLYAEPSSLVHEVLGNILSNAVKFSKSGDVIEVSIATEDSHTVIAVRDHGIGMPEVIRNNIFKEHEPTTRSGTEGESGTGFGMPLVKNYMDLYDATISLETCETLPGNGTTFYLRFRRAGSTSIEEPKEKKKTA